MFRDQRRLPSILFAVGTISVGVNILEVYEYVSKRLLCLKPSHLPTSLSTEPLRESNSFKINVLESPFETSLQAIFCLVTRSTALLCKDKRTKGVAPPTLIPRGMFLASQKGQERQPFFPCTERQMASKTPVLR